MARNTANREIGLSVVIPTHNTRQLTLDCLAALRAAQDPPEEILVVDDGSEDGTAEAIQSRFPTVHILRHESPRGFTAAANAGLRVATANILLLLNSDTEMGPASLDVLRTALASDAGLGIAGAELIYPDGRPQWSGGGEPSLLWFWTLSSGVATALRKIPGYRKLRPLWGSPRRTVAWVSGAAMALRRTVWEELGPLDERFRFYAQDLDFCTRASKTGWGVEIIPGFRVLHHHGATIRKASGAGQHQHAEFLWTDLLLWGRKQRGDAWALRARAVLILGARLRILVRALWTPCIPSSSRPRWKSASDSLKRALAALQNLHFTDQDHDRDPVVVIETPGEEPLKPPSAETP